MRGLTLYLSQNAMSILLGESLFHLEHFHVLILFFAELVAVKIVLILMRCGVSGSWLKVKV